MTVKTRITLDEFLALPETEPASEYVAGEVVQKPMPTFVHALIQSTLAVLLTGYLRRESIAGAVLTELRHAERPEDRVYVPDVSVVLGKKARPGRRAAYQGPIEYVPDIAIEILSPGDRPGRVADKLAFYLRAGVPLVWIVDPETQRIDAHRPGIASVSAEAPEVIAAEPVLPGLELDLGELFSVLDELEG